MARYGHQPSPEPKEAASQESRSTHAGSAGLPERSERRGRRGQTLCRRTHAGSAGLLERSERRGAWGAEAPPEPPTERRGGPAAPEQQALSASPKGEHRTRLAAGGRRPPRTKPARPKGERGRSSDERREVAEAGGEGADAEGEGDEEGEGDRKSTRLNSSH